VPPEPGSGEGQEDGGGQGSVPFADLAERKIVKTGEITLEVPVVGAAVGELRAMALALDGYVSGSRTGGEDDSATVTLRVPADRFDEALERLHDMDGKVRVEATKDEDVTSSVVDLEARIRNLRASEEQYRILVRRAERINDVLAVQSRLDDVRGQIEQLTAQLTQLNGLATMSTLTVTLVPASTPVEDAAEAWDPGSTFGNAAAALVSAGQAVADAAIWLFIVGLPILLIAAIGLWLAMRLRPVAGRLARPEPRQTAEE
jgi:tetrahydromethanopterin S-methyltransferase subunit G